MPTRERYAGRHRTPGRHRAPRTRLVVSRRAGVAGLGLGVAVASVAVPAIYSGSSQVTLAGDTSVADAALSARVQLTGASTTADAPVGSGVAVSRSRTRMGVLDLEDRVRAASVPPAAASAAPAAAPAVTPKSPSSETARSAPAPVVKSTSAFDAAAAKIGLRGYARVVYSAVRSTFGITNIGGYRPGDPRDHGSGHAVDVMITSKAQGDEVAAFAMAHAAEFHITYIIWRQRIWSPGGSWRPMADRGGATANHFDHVHISVTG